MKTKTHIIVSLHISVCCWYSQQTESYLMYCINYSAVM